MRYSILNLSEELNEFYDVANYSKDIDELKSCLNQVISKKNNLKSNLDEYIYLCNLECIIRQNIYRKCFCSVDESIFHLKNRDNYKNDSMTI